MPVSESIIAYWKPRNSACIMPHRIGNAARQNIVRQLNGNWKHRERGLPNFDANLRNANIRLHVALREWQVAHRFAMAQLA